MLCANTGCFGGFFPSEQAAFWTDVLCNQYLHRLKACQWLASVRPYHIIFVYPAKAPAGLSLPMR